MTRFTFKLFLAVVILSSICWKTKCEAEHKIACQGLVMTLNCLNRSFALTITSAIYGRDLPGRMICPHNANGDTGISDELECRIDVYQYIKERCDGKMNCSLEVNKETLPERCPNIYKYLDVAYKCEDVLQRGIRQLSVLNKNISRPTQPQLATEVTSPSSLTPTPSLVKKEQLFTVTTQQNRKPTPSQPVQQSASPSQSSFSHHSVSVSQVLADQYTTTSTTTTPPTTVITTATSPTITVPKTNENKTLKGNLRTIKLFHFILSFHVVREEYLQKHPANSFVWFLCGALAGLHILIGVYYCLHRRRYRRGTPDGKRDNISYLKQKFILPEPLEEKIELRSKEEEAIEMNSQFGETA